MNLSGALSNTLKPLLKAFTLYPKLSVKKRFYTFFALKGILFREESAAVFIATLLSLHV